MVKGDLMNIIYGNEMGTKMKRDGKNHTLTCSNVPPDFCDLDLTCKSKGAENELSKILVCLL